MKTTLEIPDFLFRRIKMRAAMEGRKLRDLIASALSVYLKRPGPGGKKKAKPCPFPIIRGHGKWKMPELTPEFLARLEEEEVLEGYRKSARR